MSLINSGGPKRVTWHPLEERLEKSALYNKAAHLAHRFLSNNLHLTYLKRSKNLDDEYG